MNATERWLARAAQRERLKQRDQHIKKMATRTVAVLALMAVGVIAIFTIVFAVNNSTPASASSDYDSIQNDIRAGANVSADASTAVSESVDNREARSLPMQAYAQFYFFEEDRAQRYMHYQVVSPHLTPEQIVLQVNLDLDRTPYEFNTNVAKPDSFLALVNKHFCLPYEYYPYDLYGVGEVLMRYEAALWLEQLIAAAATDGIDLNPVSGFRDASYQESLYNEYVSSVGIDWANAQSAQAGFSEHQTGLAVDFSPADYGFYDTPKAFWLEEHAYEYGFIIRYPEDSNDITLYMHEPWHVRYVGTKVSTFMHDHSISSFEEYYIKYIRHSPY